MYYSLLSIALGSVLGAWLRWFLGYKPLEAQKAVAAVKADYTESADIIRAALKSMMK